MLNIDLFEKVQTRIEKAPNQWRQADWGYHDPEEPNFCGTVACFAGWAVLINNTDVVINEYGDFFDKVTKESLYVPETAMEYLGINEERANELFYCMTDDPTEVKAIWKRWEAEDQAFAVARLMDLMAV